MSRHRNIRNMCEDDYYDYDDDYYDDDYWEEEEEEEEYQPKQSQVPKPSKQKPNSTGVKSSITATTPALKKDVATSKSNNTTTSSKGPDEKIEKERLVVSMGFTSEKAKASLEKNGWDVQKAIHDLLSGPDDSSSSSSKPATMAPPQASILTSTPTSGFSKEQTKNQKKQVTISLSVKQPPTEKPSIKIHSEKPAAATKPQHSQKTTTGTSTTENLPRSKKQISPEMQKRLESQKSRLSMVILGHVDAGKSTLMGQVLVQMGMVQKRTVAKYQKEASEIGKASFALAWIMDEDESERERGVTIDIATKYISTTNHDLTILDAPGHQDYIPAMITGAGVSDVGILVVSSTKGEFESGFDAKYGSAGTRAHVGQTREHITLAKALGVSQLIVAVNKLDAVDPAWSEYRFHEIKGKLEPFLKQSGFNLKRVQYVPISGLTGVNIKEAPSLSDDLSSGLAKWYSGKTLMKAIDSFEPAKRKIDKPFRYIVSDLYPEGKGVVVKGRVAQGLVTVGDKVAVLPTGDVATISRIDHGIAAAKANEEFDVERMKVALAGDSCDLVLTGIDIARINVGNILSDTPLSLRPKIKKIMKAKIIVMEELTVPIIRGSQVLMHMHCLDIPAVISDIISKVNKQDGSDICRPRVLTGGSNATVQIKLQEKTCLEKYSDCRSLGRFVLRRGGDTVAIGIVENIDD